MQNQCYKTCVVLEYFTIKPTTTKAGFHWINNNLRTLRGRMPKIEKKTKKKMFWQTKLVNLGSSKQSSTAIQTRTSLVKLWGWECGGSAGTNLVATGAAEPGNRTWIKDASSDALVERTRPTKTRRLVNR